MIEMLGQSQFWISLLQIIAIDILLGGDNAVVIALACRRLPEQQRNRGIFWGVFGAIALRIVLIFFALKLLAIPYLKLLGAALLVWIGIKLLQPDDDNGHSNVDGSTHLLGAIKTIVVADAVMSLDNVIAVAGAAKGNLFLVTFGIVISVPIIVWGSKLILKLMDRFPSVIAIGGALLGYIAGQMAIGDIAIKDWSDRQPALLHYATPPLGALAVVIIGTWLARRARVKKVHLADLATSGPVDPQPPK